MTSSHLLDPYNIALVIDPAKILKLKYTQWHRKKRVSFQAVLKIPRELTLLHRQGVLLYQVDSVLFVEAIREERELGGIRTTLLDPTFEAVAAIF